MAACLRPCQRNYGSQHMHRHRFEPAFPVVNPTIQKWCVPGGVVC
jgi:hypothetical protein